MSEDTGAAHAVLRGDGGCEETTSRFVAACDRPDLTPDVMHAVAARQGLVFLFALGEGATWRILATRSSQCDEGAHRTEAAVYATRRQQGGAPEIS
jgi:hypothetical protein